ncbi:MAG TPA: acyl-CoA synthetase [Polyangiaceae bacterium]|jgi:acyl-CoA synthetase (AMP-forming)/AMP-acid ligase II
MEFNIADLFESIADSIPDRLAVVSGEHRLTFAQLEARANRLANALRELGIHAGDHVGLFLYNGHPFLEAMLAAFKLRAVPININYRYVEEELAYLCSNADLKAVVVQRELLPRAVAVRDRVPTLQTIIAVEDDGAPGDDAGAHAYESLLAAASPERRFEPRSGRDHYIIYTGGTTGMPRGVVWQHEDVFFAGLQGGNAGGDPISHPEELGSLVASKEEPLTFLPAAPFIHGAAQWAALIGWFGGGKVVLSPGRSFDGRRICELIEREKVNTVTLVGDAMARPLVEALREREYDMGSLIVIASAGAVLSDAVKDELQERLPNVMILNNFGATETGHQGMVGFGEASGGKPTFAMDESNTVLGEDMRPIAPGSGIVGKLARRGHLPVGYYKDPVKTAATFVTIDGERWVIPGDLATLEEDGRITVFGRGAVCINTGGEKVFPEEVEAALKAHPGVVDAVVVGVPDEKWGSRVAAVVQARPGADVTLASLDAHCRTRIAGYKVPRQLALVEHLVRHPSGKPDYRWAAEAARAGHT